MKNSNRIFIFSIVTVISIFSNLAYSKLPTQCNKVCPDGKECRFAYPKDKERYEYCGESPNSIKDPSIQNGMTETPNAIPRPQ